MSSEAEYGPEVEDGEEPEHPDAIVQQLRAHYAAQGYSRAQINAKLRRIGFRKFQGMIEEWQKRAENESTEVARLTDAIHRGAFGLSEQEHRALKHLPPHVDLRDHMDLAELTLIAFAEGFATVLHQERGSQGFNALFRDATEAGEVAGGARRLMESALGRPVTSGGNFLKEDQAPGEQGEE
jgi:hypothetical protein